MRGEDMASRACYRKKLGPAKQDMRKSRTHPISVSMAINAPNEADQASATLGSRVRPRPKRMLSGRPSRGSDTLL